MIKCEIEIDLFLAQLSACGSGGYTITFHKL